MVIKGILKEELENSLKMEKAYRRELARLPKGSLIKKKIKGYAYYYIVRRDKGKVKFVYQGKSVPAKMMRQYEEAKKLRKKYRNLLSKVRKQIKFLRGTLRGQESI